MPTCIRAQLTSILSAVALGLTASAAAAQTYPDRPVKLVIGFGPGSAADVSTRILAEELSKTMGQRFFVEGKPGASSNIAGDSVAKSAGDGYTLFLGSIANAINASIRKGFIDLTKDLKPVGRVCTVPLILAVNPKVNAKTVKELIAVAKAQPGKLNYGSPGPGTAPHLSAELFKVMTGTEMAHVPYKGTAQAAQDLISGQIQLMFAPSSTVLGQIEAKTLTGIAWTTATRGPALPDLPTMSESGLAGFETSIWFGLTAPKDTPEAILDKLSKAVTAAVKSDTVGTAFRKAGIEPFPAEATEFGTYIASETKKWAEVSKKAGLVK
jgi:tripartite-type tricarboxylate transporter receptor subunit TctC